MRILLFGSRGFLGSRYAERFPDAVMPGVDVADASAVAAVLDQYRPETVINAAGRTGSPNVDWCEDHRAETIRSNVTGALVIGEACARRGIALVHLGTGCVYAGDNQGRGFSESDAPNFTGSVYSRCKAAADRLLMELIESGELRGLILRLRMPFDSSHHPKNLLSKIPRFSKVVDAPNSITYIPDLLDATEHLLGRGATGIYNVTNPGPVRLTDIARMYQSIVHPDHVFSSLTEEEARPLTRVPRSNCVLSSEKLERTGLALPPTMDRLDECFRAMEAIRSISKA